MKIEIVLTDGDIEMLKAKGFLVDEQEVYIQVSYKKKGA